MRYVFDYTDAKTGERKFVEIEAVGDVVGITLPAQEELPQLKVDVNSDMVIVHALDAEGERVKVWQESYDSMLTDAELDGYDRPKGST